MVNHIRENIFKLTENISSGWSINDIFIIGKGPSIDEISGFEFPDGLIININDSEKIIQGHIGIFSGNWVRHSLKERGFRCKYYIAGKPISDTVVHNVPSPIPLEIDTDELNTFRLSQEIYYDESFTLINALKVSRDLARKVGRTLNVYLLGFDFSTEKGEVSKSLGIDFAQSESTDRSLIVHSQENDFLQFVKYFENNQELKLHHVGSKGYSALSTSRFKELFFFEKGRSGVLKDQNKSTDFNNVLIVAEFTNNHLGDSKRLVEMVERTKEAGADLIKIQKRDVDTFYSNEKLKSYYWSPFGKTLRDYRIGVELDEEKLEILDAACQANQIKWFCSVLDYPSFKIIQKYNPSLIKIPSTISNHKEFHQQVAEEYQGPIVISTGFTGQEYEEYVLNTFKDNSCIYLLHCVSAYPTVMHDCNVSVVSHYKELSKSYPNLIPGYSSHDLGSFGSVLAVASGARMIEKHVKLGDVDWIHFDKVAMDLKTGEFGKFVGDIRKAQIALGSPKKKILPSEHHKYEVVKRNV